MLWITPLRALAADTAQSLQAVVDSLQLPWLIELRTSDTSAATCKKQRDRLPTVLITTPESLSLLLSYPDPENRFSSLRAVIVDEWHELMGSKRGVQTELGLARLRTLRPGLRVWGVSATIGNVAVLDRSEDEANGRKPGRLLGLHRFLLGIGECFADHVSFSLAGKRSEQPAMLPFGQAS